MGNPVLSQWCWDGAVHMPEFDRVGDDLALGVRLDKFEATVGVERRPDVESFLGAEVLRTLSGWLGMDEHAETNRT
jgi:hypothetical protein